MSKIKYIQLESGAYPADYEWLAMTATERGCYHSLIIFLCCNNGNLPNDPAHLRNLCNENEKVFENFWQKFKHKFVIKNGKVQHRRVNRELAKARKCLRQRSLAGKASGNARRTAVQQPSNGRSTGVTFPVELREGKVREGNIKKEKSKKKERRFSPPTLQQVKDYLSENPELNNIDPTDFWKGYNDGGWIDTQGKPVRNWKLKLRTRSNFARQNGTKTFGKPQNSPAQTEAERKKRIEQIRAQNEPWLRNKSTAALKDLLKDKGQVAHVAGWLIRDILKERAKKTVAERK